jgi:hypothetical protein
VLRFWADQVMTDLPAILDGIEIALRQPLPQRDGRATPIPSPLPQGAVERRRLMCSCPRNAKKIPSPPRAGGGKPSHAMAWGRGI